MNPAMFVPAEAQRLSGLTEHSDGTGRTRATVTHARCLMDVKIGPISSPGILGDSRWRENSRLYTQPRLLAAGQRSGCPVAGPTLCQ
jgi:hypothetical protein